MRRDKGINWKKNNDRSRSIETLLNSGVSILVNDDLVKSEGEIKRKIQIEKKEKRNLSKKRYKIKLNEAFVLRSNLLKTIQKYPNRLGKISSILEKHYSGELTYSKFQASDSKTRTYCDSNFNTSKPKIILKFIFEIQLNTSK
jgi:hypothetical protein